MDKELDQFLEEVFLKQVKSPDGWRFNEVKDSVAAFIKKEKQKSTEEERQRIRELVEKVRPEVKGCGEDVALDEVIKEI